MFLEASVSDIWEQDAHQRSWRATLTWGSRHTLFSLEKKKQKAGFTWVYTGNATFKIWCAPWLTTGPGMPRRPSGPGFPAGPCGPTGPVFPGAPSAPGSPWKEQTRSERGADWVWHWRDVQEAKCFLKARILHRTISWVKCLWLHREVWCQQSRLPLLVTGELCWACTAGSVPLHIATNSGSEFGFYDCLLLLWKIPHSVHHQQFTFNF